ncbi:MAG: diheme cytochrome c [Casimicrobiaceae bacterium]
MNRDIVRWTFDISAWIVVFSISVFLVVDALASERAAPAPVDATYRAECGSCHVAYPPRLLAAPAWHTIMQGLDRHFGVDATVDAQAAATIRAYLATNAQAPVSKRYDPDATRITTTRWFAREHGEIGAAVWQRASVKSAANCGACHAQAERGVFGEHNVRIPPS